MKRESLRALSMIAVVGLAGAAQAGIYQSNTFNVNVPNAGTTTVIGGLGGSTEVVRAFHLSGNWTQVSGGPWSSELQAAIPGQGGVVWRNTGGATTSNPFTHGTFGTTFNNGAAPNGFNGDVYNPAITPASLNGQNLSMRQSFGGSQASVMTGRLVVYTDAVAPSAGTLAAGPTFNRATSLTSLSGVGTAVYYTVETFVAPATGQFVISMIGNFDTFLHLYSGAFNPGSPLTNLIGVSDDSGQGLGTAAGGSSAIFISLVQNQTYQIVYTSFDNGEVGSFDRYIAGLPTPGAAALFGLAGLMSARRRR